MGIGFEVVLLAKVENKSFISQMGEASKAEKVWCTRTPTGTRARGWLWLAQVGANLVPLGQG